MEDKQNRIEPGPKERVLETAAVAMCFMLLLGCFLKVMFF